MTNIAPFNLIGLATAALLSITFGNQTARAADSLEALFKETGWDKVVGTWGAENGTETTFAFKDGELHSVTKMGDVERNTTIKFESGNKATVNSKDNKGGSSSGTAEFSAGKAVFKISTKPASGEPRDLTINYALTDADTLTVQLEGQPESATFKRK